MTRRVVYGIGVWLTVACTVMTISSIILPRWLSFGEDNGRSFSYGLHRRCSGPNDTCTKFPTKHDCEADKWSFCSMWKTVGFLMSFSVVVELCALVSLAVIIMGGVQRRSVGWKVVCPLLGFAGVVQCISMAIVAVLFDNDDRFAEGWYLDNSFILCTVSWSMLVLTATGILGTRLYLPEEGGYELIPNYHRPISHLEIEEDL